MLSQKEKATAQMGWLDLGFG